MSTTSSSPRSVPRIVSDDETSDDDLMSLISDDDDFEFVDAVSEEDELSPTAPPVSKNCPQNDISFHTRLGYRCDFVQLKGVDQKNHLQKTFAYQLFRERLVMYKLDLTKNQGYLPERFEEPNGYCYEILCSKFEKKTQDHIPKKTLTLYYVLVEGPDKPKIDLQSELDKIANWGSLPPLKIPSRLDLLFSTAVKAKGNDGLGIFTNLSSEDDFEWIPETSNVGCGFIPRRYLERFLGTTLRGRRTSAIQVRIFSPQLGVIKGMLRERPGIDKIQLPPSMQKVGPSLSCTDNPQTSLVINNIYPSRFHLQVARLLTEGETKPPVSFVPNKLNWMITKLLLSLGVSEESMEEYVKQSHQSRGNGLQHASVVGLADSTNALPPGHIFVTGTLGTEADLPELFVTRFPCTQRQDGLMLPTVTTRPDEMTTSDWDSLCNLPFGFIVFANALPREPSLPSICSNGDLDGDHYFVCWNTKLLSQIQPVEPAEGEYDDGVMEEGPHNPKWMNHVQGPLADAKRLARISELMGILCVARKKLLEDCGLGCPDAEALGRAYKDSLEVVKHGKKVRLPAHLWDVVPESIHFLLEGIKSPKCEHQDDTRRHKTTKKKTRKASTRGGGGVETSTNGNSVLQGLQEGDAIEITGGTHKAKKATFVRLTPKMVRVKVAGLTNDTCVSQRFVRPTRA